MTASWLDLSARSNIYLKSFSAGILSIRNNFMYSGLYNNLLLVNLFFVPQLRAGRLISWTWIKFPQKVVIFGLEHARSNIYTLARLRDTYYLVRSRFE